MNPSEIENFPRMLTTLEADITELAPDGTDIEIIEMKADIVSKHRDMVEGAKD